MNKEINISSVSKELSILKYHSVYVFWVKIYIPFFKEYIWNVFIFLELNKCFLYLSFHWNIFSTWNIIAYFKLTITAIIRSQILTISIKNIDALTNFVFTYKKRFCTCVFSQIFTQFKKIKMLNLLTDFQSFKFSFIP